MKRSSRHRRFRLAAIAATLSIFAAAAAIAGDLDKAKAAGKLVMITAINETGEIAKQTSAKGGQFGGVDRDVVDGFAKENGLKLEYRVSKEFGEMIPDLETGKGDLIAASLTITDERKKKVDFSKPYFPNRLVAVAKKTSGIKTMADLEGKRAITIAGTTLEAALKKIPNVIVKTTWLQQDFYRSVGEGSADFFLADGSRAVMTLPEHPDMAIVVTYPEKQSFGFAFRKGSDLRTAFDAYIDKLEAKGELDKIIGRYFSAEGLKTIKSWK